MGDCIVEQQDGVMVIRFNRPAAMNAMGGTLIQEFDEALDRARWDDRVRAVVVTGEGRAWCAGADLQAMASGGGDGEQLVGKVKALEVVAEIGGEHYADSVILDDNAYEVVEGFLGVNAGIDHDSAEHAAHDLAAATRLAVGEERAPSAELDLLARFFLNEN